MVLDAESPTSKSVRCKLNISKMARRMKLLGVFESNNGLGCMSTYRIERAMPEDAFKNGTVS